MELTSSRVDGGVHVVVKGKVTERTLPLLEGVLAAAVDTRTTLTIDLSDCSSIDPRGTLVLVRVAETLAHVAERLRVRGLVEERPGRDLSPTLLFLAPLVDLE